MENHHQPVRIAWISRSKVSSKADCKCPFYATLVLGTSDDETDSDGDSERQQESVICIATFFPKLDDGSKSVDETIQAIEEV